VEFQFADIIDFIKRQIRQLASMSFEMNDTPANQTLVWCENSNPVV